jgi:hypothetical protein
MEKAELFKKKVLFIMGNSNRGKEVVMGKSSTMINLNLMVFSTLATKMGLESSIF